MHSSPVISIFHHSSTFFTTDESALTHYNYPKFIVHITVHTQCSNFVPLCHLKHLASHGHLLWWCLLGLYLYGTIHCDELMLSFHFQPIRIFCFMNSALQLTPLFFFSFFFPLIKFYTLFKVRKTKIFAFQLQFSLIFPFLK